MIIKNIFKTAFIIEGDDSFRNYHEALIKKFGVSEVTIYTGYIPLEETSQVYTACDVFVVPSVVEAFGFLTIEAMACGKPVIGTNVGGIPDIVKNGLNGFLVKQKDASVLVEKIVRVVKDSNLRERMGKAGRETVETQFNRVNRVTKIIEVHKSLR